jgi:WD40 repeat protein
MNFSYRLSTALIGAVITVVQPQVAAPQTVDEQAIASMAKDVTVVINGQNPGSGVIVSKQGNTYYVLTAKHVVATQDEYEIVTSDAKSHKLDYSTVKKLPGVDLALVQFTSDQNYRVAELGDSDQGTEGATVYTSGWPHPGRAIKQRIYQMTKGSISGRPLEALEDGYALVYTNITRSGMSGGPVLDAQGRVIGIHGRAEGESIFNPDTGATVDVKSGFNLGIPINSFVKLASQGGMNLSYLGDNFSLANKIAGHSKRVAAVVISPDGQTLASGSADSTIKIWNRSTGKELRTLTGHSNPVNAVAVSPDGQTLVSGGEDATIKIWNLGTGQVLHTLKGDRDFVRSVAISPDGQNLATGSAQDSNIKIWNLRTGELLRTLKGHSNYVNAVAFSADSQTIASGSTDKTIKIWNLGTGELLHTLTGHSNIVTCVAINPYGQILASGSTDKTIKIWNRSTGELLRTLAGHSQIVRSVAIDPYGHILASGSDDGTIKIWNLHTGQPLRTIEVRSPEGQIVEVTSVAFSGDGQTLISGGGAGLRIWQVKR